MIPGMIAVRVGDKGERLALPWIEPQGVAGQLEPAMEPDGNQGGILNRHIPLVQPRAEEEGVGGRASPELELEPHGNRVQVQAEVQVPVARNSVPRSAAPCIDTRPPTRLNFIS